MKHSLYILLPLIVSACASITPQQCLPPAGSEVAYVVHEGWHTEIGLPVNELGNHQAFFRKEFPGAGVIMFGYGKKTFLTAPPESISEYMLGPVPGPALIQMVGLRVTPPEAYMGDEVVTLSLSEGNRRALSKYLWNDLEKDGAGNPMLMGHSTDPAGVFYAAVSRYNLLHTCNSWVADALEQSGLPLSSDGIIFSRQAMARASEAAVQQCLTTKAVSPP